MGKGDTSSGVSTADTSSVTAIKVKVVVDTTTEELRDQFKGVERNFKKSPVEIAFGVNEGLTIGNINSALKKIVKKIESPKLTLKIDDSNISAAVNKAVQKAQNGAGKASGTSVKIKADTKEATQKLKVFYDRVKEIGEVRSQLQDKMNQVRSAKPDETLSKELENTYRYLQLLRNEAAELRKELGSAIPTGKYSKLNEISRNSPNRNSIEHGSTETLRATVMQKFYSGKARQQSATEKQDIEEKSQKLKVFYDRVKEANSLYKDSLKLKFSSSNESELEELKRQLESVREEAGKLKEELSDIIPTGDYSKLSEIERSATNGISRLEAKQKDVVQASVQEAKEKLKQANITTFDRTISGIPGYTGDADQSFENRLKKLNELDSQSQEYHDTLAKIIEDWKTVNTQIQTALKSEEDLQKWTKQREDGLLSVRKAYGSVQKSLNSSAFTLPNSLAKERFDTIKLGGKTGTEAYQELNDAITRLENSKGPVEFKNTLAEVNTLLVKVREHINDATGYQSGSKALDKQSDNMKNLLRELYSYREKLNGLEKNGDLLKEYEDLYAKIDNGSISFEKAQLRVSSFKNACHEANLETETLGQKLSRLFKEHFQTAIAMAGVAMVKQGLREVYNNVLDIDTALTELRKVSSMTSSEMNDFLDRSAVKARELGVSISDLVNSTADWKRLGYTDEDAEELARISSLMVNVGDGIQSIDDASSYLISTMQGFGLAADEAERLLDCMNQIANTEPVSMNDLGLIMQRSSAAMAAAGNTYQETLSMAAAVNGVLQSPETSGTYLKTLSMYLRAAKTDAEDAGIATDGMANSVSELRTELKQLSGVDIMKDNNTFKSTYQIMKELSEVWDNLTDTTQANITELISGKRGGQSTAALLSNFSVAEDSMKQALESSGSAMRENEQYMQSLQAKINQLDAAFQQLSKDLLSSDVPKFFVSLATGAVDLADGAVKAAGALPTLTAAISGVLSVMQMSGKLKNGAGKVNMPSYVRCI